MQCRTHHRTHLVFAQALKKRLRCSNLELLYFFHFFWYKTSRCSVDILVPTKSGVEPRHTSFAGNSPNSISTRLEELRYEFTWGRSVSVSYLKNTINEYATMQGTRISHCSSSQSKKCMVCLIFSP